MPFARAYFSPEHRTGLVLNAARTRFDDAHDGFVPDRIANVIAEGLLHFFLHQVRTIALQHRLASLGIPKRELVLVQGPRDAPGFDVPRSVVLVRLEACGVPGSRNLDFDETPEVGRQLLLVGDAR